MKIALFTETYLPYTNGVATHVNSLKQGLEAMGHEVLVVTSDIGAKHHYTKDNVLHCPAFKARRFYGNGIAPPMSIKRFKYVKSFKPDIIHVHNEFGIGFSGIVFAKLLHIPVIYTLHTMYDDYIYYIATQAFTPVAKRISHHYTKAFAKAANVLTGPSIKCVKYFRKIGVKKPINVIPNPVDLKNFSLESVTESQKSEIRKKLGFSGKEIIAVFVGRLGKEKSVDILLDYWSEAIKPDENIRLLIIGEGPCKAALQAQVEKLGISDHIIFAGEIKHRELPPYLAICDFYITASTSDTNSISMLEAMAMGLPVFQITDPLNHEQIDDGVNGFVFETPAELSERIRFFCGMLPDQLTELAKSTRQSVEQRGPEDLAGYMLNIYEKAIKLNQDG